MRRFNDSPPIDLPKLTGYLLGAGAIIWLCTGSWAPLIVSGIGVAVLRNALKEIS